MTYIIGSQNERVVGKGKFAQELADKLIYELGKTFTGISGRLSIWSEAEKYNWTEDESVWKQKKGLAAEEGECYFDNEFVSAYNARDGVTTAYVKFLSGLNTLYKEGKIFINKEMYQVKAAEEELRSDKSALEIPEARNETEQMMVEIVKKQAKKRGRKTRVVK